MSELAEVLKITLSPNQDALDSLLLEHTEACETLHRGVTLNVKTGNRSWGLDTPATWTEYHQRLAILLVDYHDYCKRVAVVRAKIEARDQEKDWATVDWKHDYWHLAQWYFLCKRTRVPQWMTDGNGKLRKDSKGGLIQIVNNKQPQWEYKTERKGEPVRVYSGVKWLETAWRQRFKGRPRHLAWDVLLEPAA